MDPPEEASKSFLFWLVFVLVVCFCLCVPFWFVLRLMGLLTGLCIGPLPALLRLLTQLTALQANYNLACLLRLNVCNDLAKAMKALDGKKRGSFQELREALGPSLSSFLSPNFFPRVWPMSR